MIFTGQNINLHKTINFKKYVSCLIYVIFLIPFDINTQWLQQASPVSTGLLDCDFIDQNTGWVCGDGGVILKTTNGGVNWIQQNSGVNKRLEGIEAVDANTLYCVGWFQTILKSTNGGSNWQIIRNGQSSPPDPGLNKCFFLNANTGWLLRDNYILRTTNGCATFDSTHTVFTYLWDIYFKDLNTGVLCGDGALTMRSTDGGVIWNQVQLPLFQGGMPNLYRISFAGNNGWVIGEGGPLNGGRLVWKTTNFGVSWDSIARVPYPGAELNYSVCFTNQNTGYCGGTTGYIFKSTNEGFNWIQQNVPINGFRRDLWFLNDSLGWAVGGGGYILKTTNGGTYVGIEPISGIVPVDFKLYQNYPNPFNMQTNITFDIVTKEKYLLTIYDVTGKTVKVLFDEVIDKGTYKIMFNADGLSSGVYYYSLVSGNFCQTNKFILLK